MDSSTKTVFKRINNENEYFSGIIEKITKKEKLTNDENSYALSLSLLFYDEYQSKEKNGYMEFAYYLVLNYSLSTEDYEPLLTFSINNGLYPIAKNILNKYNNKSIQDVVCENGINLYKKDDVYQLKKQFESKKSLIESKAQNRAYIAPTSYGKSSAVIDDISKCNKNKIGIIVPKKALIWQTFRNIKAIAKKLKFKVLLCDADYCNDDRVICVFTQERAISLLQDSEFYFEVLYIDEAHNLFEKDERNMLLARLIKLNKKKNPSHRIVYLSPFIKDANDLILDGNEVVEMHRIDFSIKEPYVRLLDKNLNLEVYNRFVDEFYKIELNCDNYFTYIFKNQGDKNLLYFNRPKDIESFSKKLVDWLSKENKNLNLSYNQNIIKISNIIAKYVNKDYKLIELLKYGIVYIHGKMPDIIKDYILSEFISTKELKFLISNSSVLEGMNLSVDTIFIFDVYGLKRNELINLCGRVNRLSDVFSSNNLSKLLSNIHFIDTNFKNIDFKMKISMLRSDENDDVQNPLLEKAKPKLNDKEKEIAKQENEYISNYFERDVKNLLIKNGVSNIYKDVNQVSEHISSIKTSERIMRLDLMNKISKIFFNDSNNINDYELVRFSKSKTVEFYTNYVNNFYHTDLKTKVNYFYKCFKNSKNEIYYIGESFGEIPFDESNPTRKVYVNVKKKPYKELINLAVIKTKIEDDFIGYKVRKLVKTLFDLGLIDEPEYNKFTYGTNDVDKLKFIKMGLSPIIMNFIQENKLEKEFSFEKGVITVSDKFREILQKQDDFIKFEIGKFID